jgi:hypothetical protein
MPGTVPPDVLRDLGTSTPRPAELSDREKTAYDRMPHLYRDASRLAAATS